VTIFVNFGPKGVENFDFFSPFKKKFMFKEMSKEGPDRAFGSTHGYFRMA